MSGMTYILLNSTDFDQPWAAGTLRDVILPGMRAVILPLSYDYGWASDADDWRVRYEDESMYRYDLFRPLSAYGIPAENIRILDYYSDEPETMAALIRQADVLVLAGEDGDACMERIEDLGLRHLLQQYSGVMIGLSAGALILPDMYYQVSEERGGSFYFREGLGAAGGFLAAVHYRQDAACLGGIIRALEESSLPVVVLPEKSGFLIQGSRIDLLGEAFAADMNDLDELYRLLEAERERESYL